MWKFVPFTQKWALWLKINILLCRSIGLPAPSNSCDQLNLFDQLSSKTSGRLRQQKHKWLVKRHRRIDKTLHRYRKSKNLLMYDSSDKIGTDNMTEEELAFQIRRFKRNILYSMSVLRKQCGGHWWQTDKRIKSEIIIKKFKNADCRHLLLTNFSFFLVYFYNISQNLMTLAPMRR